jgi:hypothetical protein
MMVIRSLVAAVDDDESARESLPDLLREFGFVVQTFSNGGRFLRTRLHRSDQMSVPRHRHAGHVWTRSPTGIDALPARDSRRLHRRARS